MRNYSGFALRGFEDAGTGQMMRQFIYGLMLTGVAFNTWVVMSRFSIARLEDVFVLPFWVIWLLIPYVYPILVLRKNSQPLPAAASTSMIFIFCFFAFGVEGRLDSGIAGINPFAPIMACAIAIIAHWLSCIVLQLPFALPWKLGSAGEDQRVE